MDILVEDFGQQSEERLMEMKLSLPSCIKFITIHQSQLMRAPKPSTNDFTALDETGKWLYQLIIKSETVITEAILCLFHMACAHLFHNIQIADRLADY